MRMKIDRYKDLEHKFFEGEKLSPEDEKLLRQESDNPYFSFLKEEKQEKLELSFDDFLAKAEPKIDSKETAIVPLVGAKPKIGSGLKTYWMAASLVLFMGLTGGYLFVNEETGEINKPSQAIVKQDTEPHLIPIKDIPTTPAVITPAKEATTEPTTKEEKEPLIAKETSYRKEPNASPAIKDKPQTSKTQNQDYVYNPNYVIINGKPVYNEQEAISLTEDAFNYLASNVSKTVDHAQKVKDISLDY